MRSVVVTALVFVSVSAIWLVTQQRKDPLEDPSFAGRYVPPPTTRPELDAPIEHEADLERNLPEDAVGSLDSVEHANPAMKVARVDFGADARAQIVDFFSNSGLAESDGEHIADSVLEKAEECVYLALGDSNVDSVLGSENRGLDSNQIEACMFNVFADHGLREFPTPEKQMIISVRR